MGFALGLSIGVWAVERDVEKWEKGGDLLGVRAVERFGEVVRLQKCYGRWMRCWERMCIVRLSSCLLFCSQCLKRLPMGRLKSKGFFYGLNHPHLPNKITILWCFWHFWQYVIMMVSLGDKSQKAKSENTTI